jgi:hypothetical protein
MNLDIVTVQGTLKADGSLQLDEKPALAPGRVQVTLQTLATISPSAGDRTMTRSTAAAGKAGGRKPDSKKTTDPAAVACHEADGNQTPPTDPGDPTGVATYPDEDRDLIETMEAEQLMPPIGVLEKMADRLHPPQSWFDEEVDSA